MPAGILAWMGLVQGFMLAAPDVIAFAGKVKQWIADMFSSGLITASEQDALNERVTQICRAAITNTLPPHWQLDPDPS